MARTGEQITTEEIIALEELNNVANNSMIHKDNLGNYQAITIGASGTVPTSNGPTSDPTFQPGGTGDFIKGVDTSISVVSDNTDNSLTGANQKEDTDQLDDKTIQNATDIGLLEQEVANLATATGEIVNSTEPVFAAISTTETDIPFTVTVPSTNTDVLVLDDANDEIDMLQDVPYNFNNTLVFELGTNQLRTITLRTRRVSDNLLISERDIELEGPNGDMVSVQANSLITPGSNGVPSSPLTVKVTIQASDTGIGFDTFNARATAGANISSTIETFDALSDTPATKSGEAGKLPFVNAGETDLEYSTGFLWDDVNKIHTLVGTVSQTLVAVADNEIANEIDVDAAGFGNIKALGIEYTSGASVAGDDVGVILTNINETSSGANEIAALGVLTTDEGSADVFGLKTGIQVSPIKQASGTFGNMTSILVNAVDELTALSSGGAGNVPMFVADSDTITIGNTIKFSQMEIILGTGASGSGINPIFEFSTGVGTWATFSPTDGTNGFRDTGSILWNTADIPAWVVGTGSEFLIRITRNRNMLTTVPITDEVQISTVVIFSWDKDGKVSIGDLQINTSVPAVIGQVWTADDAGGNGSWQTGGAGDVVGPASATDERLARYDGTTGKLLQNSVVRVDDGGNMTGVALLDVSSLLKLSGSLRKITDGGNNEYMEFLASTPAPVNHIAIKQGDTGDAPEINADGNDTNVDLSLNGQGTGVIKANGEKVLTSIAEVRSFI